MTKNKIAACSIAIVMLLGMVSCKADLDSRYFELVPINEITIVRLVSGDGDTGVYIREVLPGGPEISRFEAILGSEFVLNAELAFAFGEANSPLEFRWYELDHQIGAGPTSDEHRLLSEKQTLTLQLDADFGNTARPYRLKVVVTDTHTRVSVQRQFQIQVRSVLQTGWYALTERQNSFELDIVTLFQGDISQVNNALYALGSTLPREGHRPISILAFPNNSAPTIRDRDLTNFSIVIHTDRGANAVRSGDFSWEPHLDISSFAINGHPVLTPGFVPNRLIPMLGAPTLAQLNNGIVTRLYIHYGDDFYFFNRWNAFFPAWEPVNVIFPMRERVRVAPYIAGSLQNGVLMFDLDNNRFIRHISTGLFGPALGTASHLFLVSNLVTDHLATPPFRFNDHFERLLYMNTFQLHQGFAIVESTPGTLQFLRFTVGGVAATAVVPNFAGTFADNAMVESIEHWAMHQGGVFLYMATADRLWRVNTAADMAVQDITYQLGLPTGYRISTLDFLSEVGGGAWFQPFLTVGSYNPGGAVGTNGRLDMFDVDTGVGATGHLTLRVHTQSDGTEVPMSFTGMGRPVSVAYRIR